jgi:hypothetical protein
VTPARPHWREVARRTGDGVEVALLWDNLFNRVKVAVSDERLCHYVDLDIADADAAALTAFQEPFAEATMRLVASERTGDR